MRRTIPMARRKNIALVPHDNRKEELLEWAENSLDLLGNHSLCATGTTGQLLPQARAECDPSTMWGFGRRPSKLGPESRKARSIY